MPTLRWRFQIFPPWDAFSKRSVFGSENAVAVWTNGRNVKKTLLFSPKNVAVWTGPRTPTLSLSLPQLRSSQCFTTGALLCVLSDVMLSSTKFKKYGMLTFLMNSYVILILLILWQCIFISMIMQKHRHKAKHFLPMALIIFV